MEANCNSINICWFRLSSNLLWQYKLGKKETTTNCFYILAKSKFQVYKFISEIILLVNLNSFTKFLANGKLKGTAKWSNSGMRGLYLSSQWINWPKILHGRKFCVFILIFVPAKVPWPLWRPILFGGQTRIVPFGAELQFPSLLSLITLLSPFTSI